MLNRPRRHRCGYKVYATSTRPGRRAGFGASRASATQRRRTLRRCSVYYNAYCTMRRILSSDAYVYSVSYGLHLADIYKPARLYRRSHSPPHRHLQP